MKAPGEIEFEQCVVDFGSYDHLFTPEVIVDLDQISAEIKAGGKTYSDDEIAAYIEETRREWLAAISS